MLYLVKNDDEQFYTNPEDAKKYYEKGYKIIDENTGHILTETEIENLKPEIIVIPIQ